MIHKELDGIFDNFDNNTIFRDKSLLQSNYIPDQILHREEQIKQIASILAPVLRGEKPSNLFLYGKTGTGKTLSINYVSEELQKRPQKGLPTQAVYSKFIDMIDSEKQLIVLVLDEIDQAVKKISSDFLYNLTRLNSELSKSQ